TGFIRAPGIRCANVVASIVCGIRLTENRVLSTVLTVRLTPSTQTEPFAAMKRASPAGASTSQHCERASGSIETMRPTPSTCPETRCPPRRSESRNAFSRFTASPSRSAPSVVSDSVSLETSTENSRWPSATTVRHTPVTEMLSPTRMSEKSSAGAAIDSRKSPPRGSRRAMVPVHWTMPVNIALLKVRGGKAAFGFPRSGMTAMKIAILAKAGIQCLRSDGRPQQQPHILANAALIHCTQRLAVEHMGERRQMQQRPRLITQQYRRDVKQEFVHQTRLEQYTAQPRPGLDLQFVDLALREQPHQFGKIKTALRAHRARREFRARITLIGWLRTRRVQHQRRCAAVEQMRRGGQRVELRVEYNPQWLDALPWAGIGLGMAFE